MFCSAHILNEVRWLLNSTTQWSRIDKQLWLLRASLPDPDRAFAIDQESHNGSWGVCYVGWLKLKLSRPGDRVVVHRIDGEVRKATDLSFTYHVVANRKGEVPHRDRIVDITPALHGQECPYGWQHHGTMTDHNAYDVVRILEYGWQLRGHAWIR